MKQNVGPLSSSYTELVICTWSVNNEHLQLDELTYVGCFGYRCVAYQALSQLFHHYSRVMFPVHIQYR